MEEHKIEPRCYIIMNKGLEMPVGKLAVQIGHSMDMVHECYYTIRDELIDGDENITKINMHKQYTEWKEAGRKKVLLRAKNDEELQELMSKLLAVGYVAFNVFDNGVNFFDGVTRTGIVVFPVLNSIKELKRVQVYK